MAKASDKDGAERHLKYIGEAQELMEYCKAHGTIDILYNIGINTYKNEKSVETVISHYR